jgi:hypothetical protein
VIPSASSAAAYAFLLAFASHTPSSSSTASLPPSQLSLEDAREKACAAVYAELNRVSQKNLY